MLKKIGKSYLTNERWQVKTFRAPGGLGSIKSMINCRMLYTYMQAIRLPWCVTRRNKFNLKINYPDCHTLLSSITNKCRIGTSTTTRSNTYATVINTKREVEFITCGRIPPTRLCARCLKAAPIPKIPSMVSYRSPNWVSRTDFSICQTLLNGIPW